jgi:hypothetical protein
MLKNSGENMKKIPLIFINTNAVLILTFSLLLASFQLQARTELHPAIPLLDEQGKHVLDTQKTYSPKMSCGGCHDYDAITSAYHFDMGHSESRDDFGKDSGIALLSSPGYFGGYNCMGSTNNDWVAKKSNEKESDFADRGAAGWIQRCAGCHTGGGWMEKDRDGKRYDETDSATVSHLDGDYFNRGTDENNRQVDDKTVDGKLVRGTSVVSQWDWKKSGVVEANCFKCHADLSALVKTDPDVKTYSGGRSVDDPARMIRNVRRNALINYGHFRESNTAILEVLNLNNTDDAALDKTLLSFTRADLDGDGEVTDEELVFVDGEPQLSWNTAAFDVDRKATIPMLRFPENENCMACHSTSNSRRGFYGFGEDAAPTLDEDGIVEDDYKDDVHKGLTWTENGETRPIENCNSCHSRNYYQPAHASVELHADHNFLKGNSDMDLRNDLDYQPSALSCVYCHDDAETPAIPSEHANMLEAHKQRWITKGDMAGYTVDSLSHVTQTHLDMISCESCHITDKAGRRGAPLQIMYRYRQAENGLLQITPYAQRDRIYWKDKNSGTILNKTERNSVFEVRGGDADAGDGHGHDSGSSELYGVIVDPETGAELAEVSARMSHGSMRFGEPADYAGYLALRNAYNKVFKAKGLENPEAVMVLLESNQYILSHNTRPAFEALQCADCHKKKQNGSFSALVADDSVFGTTNTKDIFTIVDMRLVSEGIFEFDKDYMKATADAEGRGGVVSINVADILQSSRRNPSLSALNKDIAKVMSGKVYQRDIADAMALAGITNAGHIQTLYQQSGDKLFVFTPTYGDPVIQKVSIMPMVNSQTELTFPTYMFKIALADNDVVNAAANAGFGGLNAPVFSLMATDTNGEVVSSFGNANVLVKLPYTGSETSVDKIKLITSSNGTQWSQVDAANVVLLKPQSAEEDGYLVFNTAKFSYFTITSADETGVSAIDEPSSAGEKSGGVFSPWLLLMFVAVYALRFRNKR